MQRCNGLALVSRQWIKGITDETITLPIAFTKSKFVAVANCTESTWLYENVTVSNDTNLNTVTAWSASESQSDKIVKPKNIIAIGV